MADLVYAVGALEDLDAIYAYTLAEWGAVQAETYIQKIEHGCETFDAAAPSWRSFDTDDNALLYVRRIDHHFVFMMLDDERSIVLAVFHERMDLMARLRKRLERVL